MLRHTIAMFAIASAAPLAALAQDGPVSPKDIQEQWVGKTVSGDLPSGRSYTMELRPDGTAKLVVATIPYRGTWRLSDTGYCAAWQGIRSGEERCATVKREGGEFIILGPDGVESGRVSKIK